MHRIQMISSKGWRLPAGAKNVARRPLKDDCYVGTPHYWGTPYPVEVYGREWAIALYRQDVERMTPAERDAWLAPLRQATALACWCSLEKACHADVLLEYLERQP